MIKRSQALHSLFTRGTALSDANGKTFKKLRITALEKIILTFIEKVIAIH